MKRNMNGPLKRSILLTCLLAVPGLVHAEDHFSLGYSNWNYGVTGNYQDSSGGYDLGNGYEASHSSRALFRLRWDTGPGWWPDAAASYGRIAVTGQSAVNTSLSIGPLPLGQVNSTAVVDANVRDLDATLRYPLQLGWGRLSTGVTVKQLRGDVLINDSAAATQTYQTVNAVFPMAHLFLEVPLGSRLRIGVGGDWIAAQGDEADSIVAIARLKVIGPLDLTAGWQSKRYKVITDSYRLDSRLQGAQVGAELSF
jgi:hypothetical protein